MTERKKHPKREARKPRPTKPSEAELVPHKIIGQLIGARYNEHGDMVGEEVMGEVAIYRANFSRVDKIIDEAVEQAHQGAGS